MADLLLLRRDTASNWTSNDPTLSTGELGYETDTGYLKVGDGSTAWTSLNYINKYLTSNSIGSSVQAYDADLDTIAGLAATSGNFIVGNASNQWASVSTASAKTALGLGTLADQNTVSDSDLSGTVPIANGGTGATDAATARTNLGLAIGTDVLAYDATYLESSDIGTTVQAYDSNLTSFVSTFTLPTSDGTNGQVLVTNGSGTLSFASAGIETTVVSTTNDLPGSPSAGDIVFVTGDTSFYIYDGTDAAWKYIATTELSTYSFQGSNYGYASGGDGFPAWSAISNVIEKFSFSADSNATDVGDLTAARASFAGQSSTTHGYTSGGYSGSYLNTIDKFSFTSDGNATDVGDRTVAKYGGAGQSSETYGYTSGGTPTDNTIDKFPFATDANATDVGDLTVARYNNAGQSSTMHGYTTGGWSTLDNNIIDKFSFTSDANATDVGDLTAGRSAAAGQSSTTHGYTSGGTSNVIDKFSFSTDANATSVGTLSVSRTRPSGQSSTASGYSSGGDNQNVIDKFPFATDANATDVGDLLAVKRYAAGQQY